MGTAIAMVGGVGIGALVGWFGRGIYCPGCPNDACGKRHYAHGERLCVDCKRPLEHGSKSDQCDQCAHEDYLDDMAERRRTEYYL